MRSAPRPGGWGGLPSSWSFFELELENVRVDHVLDPLERHWAPFALRKSPRAASWTHPEHIKDVPPTRLPKDRAGGAIERERATSEREAC